MLLNAMDDRLTMEWYASHSVSRTWSVIGPLRWCWWDVVHHLCSYVCPRWALYYCHHGDQSVMLCNISGTICASVSRAAHSIQLVMIYRVPGCVILTVRPSSRPCILKINLWACKKQARVDSMSFFFLVIGILCLIWNAIIYICTE